MPRNGDVIYCNTNLYLITRYWCDNYLSNEGAVPSDLWCCNRAAPVSSPLSWDNYGRS